jgi:hypothetical protein
MIPVEGHPNLYRDEKSGSIINYDTIGYNHYQKLAQNKLSERQEIDKIKTDIAEIKSLLKELINGSR